METTCPSVDERIRKFWYIYTMEYYSAIKRNAFESVLMRRMNLEPAPREVTAARSPRATATERKTSAAPNK